MSLSRLAYALGVVIALAAADRAQAQLVYAGGYLPSPVVARTYSAQVYYANYAAPVFSPIPSVYLAGPPVGYPTPGMMYQAGYTTYAVPAPVGVNAYGTFPTYQFGYGYGGWGYGRGWAYYGWGW